jgi:hypothetical protein
MPTNEQIKETVEKLRAQFVHDLFEKAINIDYWQNFIPGMGVLDQHQHSGNHTASSVEQENFASAHLAKHGYFKMSPIVSSDVIARMCTSVELLRRAGWPAVFSYVYDEFWLVWRLPSIVRFLSRHLGVGYLQTSGVWTYWVDPQTRASGWPPHVDSRNNAERISVWIPLTDAIIENGCMYVIPQDSVPPALPICYLDWKTITATELATLLHNVIPLPAARGSVLGWNNRLIHWGGRAMNSAASPRISIAAEFLHETTTPHRSELPVFDVNLPEFSTRLRVIGQAILVYEKFEPGMRRYRDLATKLLEWESCNSAVDPAHV